MRIREQVTILLSTLLLASCGLVEFDTSDNGKLDGNWHLQTVDTLSTGRQANVRNDRIFWAIQGTIFQLYTPSQLAGLKIVSHFSHDNDQLHLYDMHIADKYNGDPALSTTDSLRFFGINALDETFAVEELTGSKMTLRGDLLRLSFKKE